MSKVKSNPDIQPAKVAAIAANIIIEVESFIVTHYKLRWNVITKRLEHEGVIMDDRDINSLYVKIKKKFRKATFSDFEKVLFSNSIEKYNPLIDFFNANEHLHPEGLIDKAADSLLTTDYNFTRHFFKKWLVSIIASVYGQPSRLMFILAGAQNLGKTEFFRRLPPPELKPYCGEFSHGLKDNDLNILMTEKIILLDDEFGVRTKREDAFLKALLSKDIFSLRLPYGHTTVDLKRIAVLAATSNEDGLLSDSTGNSRLVPVMTYSVNQDDYNAINKTELFMEAYHLYKSGFNCNLTAQDRKWLDKDTAIFESHSPEYELIQQYIMKPDKGGFYEELSATLIKNKLETLTAQRLSLDRVGKELKRLGFEQLIKWQDGKTRRLWKIYIPTLTPITP